MAAANLFSSAFFLEKILLQLMASAGVAVKAVKRSKVIEIRKAYLIMTILLSTHVVVDGIVGHTAAHDG